MAGLRGPSIGVLMIGSLFWDKCRKHRKEWRRSRLDLDAARHVKVPIRYGRRSESRACTYTMVFSMRLAQTGEFGHGIVVPCKSHDLLEEAVCLWTAEKACGNNPQCAISAKWGCVAVLENPDSPMPDDVRNAWIERVKGQPGYGKLNAAKDEKVAVDARGFLRIPWPEPVEGPDVGVDMLLATATNPTLTGDDYASAIQITDAWMTSRGKREVSYFWNNRKKGIKTFEDEKIRKRLSALGQHSSE